ncbi:uncharacterized protein A4U43_C02F2930 [Asparagus officinalis]|uniref:Nodulin-like domain-containing protein n=1 Tax=Asparagus officinalis TaxID=4686 RepID=A0A5P1FH79_ASPOF|nr:uncharacterized protein A4U43_C02F2930 [Asparagus officinalis]
MLAGNSICWVNTACYVASMREFPNDHGVVVGLATSYTGLSAKIYIVIAQVILGKNFTSKSIYLLLNAVVPIGLAIVTAPFLTESKPSMNGNGRGLSAVFVLAGITGARVVGRRAVGEVFGGNPVEGASYGERGGGLGGDGGEVVEVREVKGGEEESKKSVGSEHGVWKLVRSVDFWLYFLVYLCGGTMGLVYANNLGQVANSRGVQEAALLSISSTFGFFGKLSAAPLSLFTRSKYMVSRPAFVATLMVPMAGSFFLLLVPTKAFLFFSTAIIGMCTGAITSIAVSMTADLFGLEKFSVNHNIVVANIPIGSFVFGYIAALIYDKEGGGGGRGLCVGMHCYSKTFVIWGSICTFGALLSFVLYVRTRKALSKR